MHLDGRPDSGADIDPQPSEILDGFRGKNNVEDHFGYYIARIFAQSKGGRFHIG